MEETVSPRRIDLARWAFSSAGRMGRLPFVIVMAAVLAARAAYDDAVHGWLRGLTGWAVWLALVFVASCVLSKRLHDRGRSGWWAAPILWAFSLAWPWPAGVWGVAGLLALIWVGFELALMPGEPGSNRFGPPPAA